MTMRRLPLFTWMNFVNSFIVILALPVLNAGLAMILIDRQLNAHFFLPSGGGSAIMWQHIFWAFGHPEVYIVALPAFGLLSEIIPVFSRKPIFGYEFVACSTVAIAILSLAVWAHHMFTVGARAHGGPVLRRLQPAHRHPDRCQSSQLDCHDCSAAASGSRRRCYSPPPRSSSSSSRASPGLGHAMARARLADQEQLLPGRAFPFRFRSASSSS